MKYLIPLAIASSVATAHAKEIRFNDCPPGVRATITANLKGGRLDGVDRVTLAGKTRFIVDIDGPAGRDVTFRLTPAGRVLFTSDDLTLSECPPAVRASIKKILQPGWTIDDIDREVTGKSIRFRVDFDVPNNPDLEFLISRNGEVLQRKAES